MEQFWIHGLEDHGGLTVGLLKWESPDDDALISAGFVVGPRLPMTIEECPWKISKQEERSYIGEKTRCSADRIARMLFQELRYLSLGHSDPSEIC